METSGRATSGAAWCKCGGDCSASSGRKKGLGDSLINTVCEDAQGAVWIGTHSGIVGRYENGVCTNLVLPGPARTQDSCVVADARGRVWIGAQGIGLLMSEGGQLRPIATETQLQGYPRLLLPGRDGRLWVGTLWSIISVTNGTLTFEYTSQTAGDHPTALAEAADGTIWAGTLDGLLLRWDGKQFVPLEPPDRSSLGRIWALWAAPDGSLWAGTEEGGLLHWSNGKFFRYTMKNGLPSDCIVQILGDARGQFVAGNARRHRPHPRRRAGPIRTRRTGRTAGECLWAVGWFADDWQRHHLPAQLLARTGRHLVFRHGQ